MSRPRGRPRKPPEQALSVDLHVRLTAPEADLIYRTASKYRITSNALLRQLVRRALRHPG